MKVRELYNDFDFYVLPSTSGMNLNKKSQTSVYLNKIKDTKPFKMDDLENCKTFKESFEEIYERKHK